MIKEAQKAINLFNELGEFILKIIFKRQYANLQEHNSYIFFL